MEYYTAQEAMKLLNKSRSAFYREVEDGTIPNEIEHGRKRGRKYPKPAIDALVHLMKRGNKTPLTFGPSTNNDIWLGAENTRAIYGEQDIVSFQRLLEWKEINPEIFMSAREGEKRVGGVTFLPLAESTIHALLDDKIREKDIPDWDIKKWTEPGLSVYIPNISIASTGDKRIDGQRGRFVIRQAIRWALSLHKQYSIKNWYGYAATPEGKKLLQRFGFRPIAGKRDAYILDDLERSTGLLRDFMRKIDAEDPDVPLPSHQREP